MIPRLTYPKVLLIIGLGFTCLVIAFLATRPPGPITRQMVSVHGYYGWIQGHCELTPEICVAFKHDSGYQDYLIGESVDWVLARFPNADDGASYASTSYRGRYSPRKGDDGLPIDKVYWLDILEPDSDDHWRPAKEDRFGFCVLVRQGRIVDFRWIKG